MSKDHIIRYSIEQPLEYRLPSNEINFWYQDQQNSIGTGTKNGLFDLVPSAVGIYKLNRIISQQIAIGKNYATCDETIIIFILAVQMEVLLFSIKKQKHFSIKK